MPSSFDHSGSGSGSPSPGSVLQARVQRWTGQGYADITKLRELSARHERNASKLQARAAHIQTRIEKLRHGAALLREKGQKILGRIPELEQEMAQHERTIQTAMKQHQGRTIGSDITGLHYRIRQLQQRIVDTQHKARTYEHKAALRTQKTAELKVRADRYLEESRIQQQEADNYRKRADRLQLATEADATQMGASAGPSAAAAGDPPTDDSPPELPVHDGDVDQL
jgi:chromosome segregation ATPase